MEEGQNRESGCGALLLGGIVLTAIIVAVSNDSFWDGAQLPPGVPGRSVVRLDNMSGEPAVVRLVGPTFAEVEVPDGSVREISNVSPGWYHIVVRYGASPPYRYLRGERFRVKETRTTASDITFSLHTVRGGNYRMFSASASEFEAATASR